MGPCAGCSLPQISLKKLEQSQNQVLWSEINNFKGKSSIRLKCYKWGVPKIDSPFYPATTTTTTVYTGTSVCRLHGHSVFSTDSFTPVQYSYCFLFFHRQLPFCPVLWALLTGVSSVRSLVLAGFVSRVLVRSRHSWTTALRGGLENIVWLCGVESFRSIKENGPLRFST